MIWYKSVYSNESESHIQYTHGKWERPWPKYPHKHTFSTLPSSVYNRYFLLLFCTRFHVYLSLVWYEHKSQTRNLFLWTGTGCLSYDQNLFRIIQQTSLSSTTLARIVLFCFLLLRVPFDTVYHWPVSLCASLIHANAEKRVVVLANRIGVRSMQSGSHHQDGTRFFAIARISIGLIVRKLFTAHKFNGLLVRGHGNRLWMAAGLVAAPISIAINCMIRTLAPDDRRTHWIYCTHAKLQAKFRRTTNETKIGGDKTNSPRSSNFFSRRCFYRFFLCVWTLIRWMCELLALFFFYLL